VTFGGATGLWRDDAAPARAPRSLPESPEGPRVEWSGVGPRWRSFEEIMADQGDEEDSP
jgi:hypothetical protein